MPSAPLSGIRGEESLELNLWWLGILTSGVSVLLLWFQSCVPLPGLPGSVSALTSSTRRDSPSSFPLLSTGPQYPCYPFALTGLGTPFLQGLLYCPLFSLPLQIPIVTWRPQLIPLSTVLAPQTWLTCSASSSFPLSLPHIMAAPHITDCTRCWGCRMRETEQSEQGGGTQMRAVQQDVYPKKVYAQVVKEDRKGVLPVRGVGKGLPKGRIFFLLLDLF